MERTCPKGRCRSSWWRLGAIYCILGSLTLGLSACGPPWWRRGRQRRMHRSYAEVELLSRLAELLMPQQPIGKLFRDFPARPSQEPRWLSPGIAAFGVLEDEGAALFVEYDGSHGHTDAEDGKEAELKTNALLQYAPKGSHVVRIAHAARGDPGRKWVDAIVNAWREGHEPSLTKAVSQTVWAMLSSCGIAFREDVRRRLDAFEVSEPKPRFKKACEFASKAVVTDVEAQKANVLAFLEEDVDLSRTQIEALTRKYPAIWGISVNCKLKPTVAWFGELGLSREQVAKVVAGFPPVLGCSIEGNLKPTVAWLEDVGLSRQQAAKVVCGFPAILGYSLHAKLKPAVDWLEDIGLSRKQVAKVIAGHPQVLGCGIESNLKSTLTWLDDIGLSQKQVLKVVAEHPAVLWYLCQSWGTFYISMGT